MKPEPSFNLLRFIGVLVIVGAIALMWGLRFGSKHSNETSPTPQITRETALQEPSITPTETPSLVLAEPTKPPLLMVEGQISAATAPEVQELMRLSGKRLVALDWMPDGKTIVVATSGGIDVYDSTTLALIQHWPTTHEVRNLVIAPNGALVAGTLAERIIVWRASNGEVVAELEAPAIGRAVAFSPNGSSLFGAGDGYFWQWSVETWERTQTIPLPSGGKATDVAFSEDGTRLAVSMWTCETHVFDIAQTSFLVTVGVSCAPSFGEAKSVFSADGSLLITANPWQPIGVWDIRDPSITRTLGTEPPSMAVLALEGPILATTSQADQPEVLLRDPQNAAFSETLSARGGVVTDLALSPQGSHVAVTTSNNTLIIWDRANPNQPQIMDAGFSRVLGLTISDDGQFVAALSDQNTPWLDDDRLLVWNTQTGTSALYHLDGYQGAVTLDGAQIPPNQEQPSRRSWLLDAGTDLHMTWTDGAIWNWNITFGSLPVLQPRINGSKLELTDQNTSETTVLDVGSEIKGFTISNDNHMVAISDATTNVSIWSIPERRELKRLPLFPVSIAVLRFASDGSHLVGLTYDFPQKLVVWNVETAKLIHSSEGISSMNPGEFSRDNSLIMVINQKHVELRQVSDSGVLKTLIAQPAPVITLTLSANGTHLLTGHTDGSLVIWGLKP